MQLFFLYAFLGVPFLSASSLADQRRFLISGSAQEQQQSMAALAKVGRPAVPLLLEVIRDEKDPMAKARAGSALHELFKNVQNRASEDLKMLSPLANSADGVVADAALESVALFREEPEARIIIRKSIQEKRNEMLRAKAIGWLAVVSNYDPAEAGFLQGLLADESEIVRIRAAYSLGRMGHRDGLPLLIEILNRVPDQSRNWALLWEAASAAGAIGSRDALPALEKIAKSNKYGPAKAGAKMAIKEIELKGIATREKQLIFLAKLLGNPYYARWAAGHLLDMPGHDTIAILNPLVEDPHNPGREAASRVLSALRAETP